MLDNVIIPCLKYSVIKIGVGRQISKVSESFCGQCFHHSSRENKCVFPGPVINSITRCNKPCAILDPVAFVRWDGKHIRNVTGLSPKLV